MLILGYLNNSEVNLDHLMRLGLPFGVEIVHLDLRDDWRKAEIDGLVIDHESWPHEDRERILDDLLRPETLPLPVAIHGYDLDGQWRLAALRRQGAGLFRRLSPAIFAFLDRQCGFEAA